MFKNNKKIIVIIIMILLLIMLMLISLVYKKINDDKIKLSQKRKDIYKQAEFFCNSLYQDGIVKSDILTKDIDKCLAKIDIVYDKNSVTNLKYDALKAKEYITFNNLIDKYYNNGIVLSSVTKENIDELNNELVKIDDKYKSIVKGRIDDISNEYDNMNNTIDIVKALFSDYDNNIVIDSVDRDKYNNTKSLVDYLKQDDLKSILNEKMGLVLTELEKKEAAIREQQRLERERIQKEKEERQRVINEAWVKLNVPYISQNRNGVLNGCEAASMLMSLQYKGYLTGTDLHSYATNMPKSDNPNTGFYLDIFGKEPRDVAHWIAPVPLINYGISSSGYGNIVNISGVSIDDIANEIINGNPVIVYLTYNYSSPVNWNGGAPRNLHVQVIVGYNKVTGEFIIYDPWTRTSGQYQFTLSKDSVSSLYNAVGSRAIAVR